MNLGSLTKVAPAFKSIASKGTGRALLMVQKHSPEILVATGIAGVVTAGVLAAKATLHLEPIIDRAKEDLEVIHELHSESDEKAAYAKELTKIYFKRGTQIVKLYGPSVTLAAASIGCILAAHGILKKRNAALVAAYNVLQDGFQKYRDRVVEELGEEKDRDFLLGLRDEIVQDESGNDVKIKVKTGDPSIYARFFDESNPNWEKKPEHNLYFLKCHQTFANQKLQAQGHLFLNEVYDSLGMPRSSAGAVVGWVLNKDGNGGDNYVDFGIYGNDNMHRAFVNGTEDSVLLDFNVDGLVYDLIEKN
jgi:hypothetical protein